MGFFKKRIMAFGFAFSGLFQAFKTEAHLKIQLVAALAVTWFGFYVSLSKADWLMVLTCIFMVICLEMLNSALEKLCDVVMPEKHPKIKYIKDVAAGAVLLACLFSALVGIMVFWPYVSDKF